MSSNEARRTASNYSTVLTRLFELMLAGGMNRKDILATSTKALAEAKVSTGNGKSDSSGDLATAALVLDRWHRDRRYLTASGNPRAMRLLGPGPSVEALIRSQPGRKRTMALVRFLKSQHLLIPCGNDSYKPASDVALLSQYDAQAIQHVTRSLSMLLETIRQNLSRGSASARLIERIAEVPDLPLSQVEEFRQFTQIHGWILLRTVNDWLEARRSPAGPTDGQKTVRAGIHVHTYVGSARRSAPNIVYKAARMF